MGTWSARATTFVGLMAVVFAGVAQAQVPQTSPRPPVGGIGSAPDAMIFYLARGPAGACRPDCSACTAAEGAVQWDSPKRLIAILDRQNGGKLPVVIHSWGE